VNVFSFTARLGADAEVKHVGESTVTEFRVAVSSGYGDKEKTTWLQCAMWGKRGEAVAPYLTKGQQVAVSGELTNREYDRNDGSKGYSLEVRVNDMTLLGSKPAQQNTPPAAAPAAQEEFKDNDIPF